MKGDKKEYVATRSLRYGTRSMRAGEVFEAPEHHGKLLVAIKKARPATGEGRGKGSLEAPPKSLTQTVSRQTSAPAPGAPTGRRGRRARAAQAPEAKAPAPEKPVETKPEIKTEITPSAPAQQGNKS